jgi:hypothetical protein
MVRAGETMPSRLHRSFTSRSIGSHLRLRLCQSMVAGETLRRYFRSWVNRSKPSVDLGLSKEAQRFGQP